MSFLRGLWRRLCWLVSRSRFYSELADEIQFHIESRAAELERGGVPAREALATARREFGSPLKASEDTSGVWQIQWLEDLFSDLRYAARAFRRNPGFAATAIFCLALGIGANMTIFNITTSFLFSEDERDYPLICGMAGLDASYLRQLLKRRLETKKAAGPFSSPLRGLPFGLATATR